VGRPAKDIDPETVRKLAKLGATQEDVAEWFGCSRSVISERFRSDFDMGRAESKISLRRLQWKAAMGGSVPMLIHLGKVYLGQTDRVDVTSRGRGFVQPVFIERARNPRDVIADNEVRQPSFEIVDNGRDVKLGNDIEPALESFGYIRPLVVLPAKELAHQTQTVLESFGRSRPDNQSPER
jgi:hypothetical protein